jgi:adenylyl-sulfate kinase
VHEKDAPLYSEEDKLNISGTQAREMFERGQTPPEWFMRPEISEIITNAIKSDEEVFVKEKKSGTVVWFTGLSGAGKTTLAVALEERLLKEGLSVERLDRDVVRQSLTKDLGFSKEDRDTNIERVTFVAKLLARNNVITLVSFISPYKKHRDMARDEVSNFIEVHVNCALEECERRDVKGMYKKARQGEIQNFTGINDPYEAPDSPEIEVKTDQCTIEEGVEQIYQHLKEKSFI